MEIARPQLPPEPETSADPARMLLDEEVVGAAFRGVGFGAFVREHLSVQGCRFTGCSFAGSVLGHSQFSDVLFRNCDFSNADLQGCSFHRVSFADSDIRGIRVREIDSFELKGVKINVLQAAELARLLGVEIEE
ncbi:MAG: pentapeptide repeat-containing protein [Alistipes senegalensis]|nr:pentapeptide repeat-containing protein [Alistipes senegalensis]